MSDAVLRVEDLAVVYDGSTVLDVAELEVRRHEVLTLVGHNGSGKSTLQRCLGLLSPPTRGRIWFEGREVRFQQRELLTLRRRMADVLQQPLLCRMSVYRNVAMGLRFRKLPRREIEARVTPWLERLRISHLRDRQAAGLSGGEAQRTSLARALVLEPEVLFLDEPFSALDAPSRAELIAEFQEILAETRTTTVFATHDRSEALAFGDRVAVLQDGVIQQIASPEQLFSEPVSEEVARFVGVETLIPGRVVSHVSGVVDVEAHGRRLQVVRNGTVEGKVLVCVRPENVTLTLGVPADRHSARNTLTGPIVRIVPTETHMRVTLDCGVPIVALVTRPSFESLGLAIGTEATASFKATGAHLIPRPGATDPS